MVDLNRWRGLRPEICVGPAKRIQLAYHGIGTICDVSFLTVTKTCHGSEIKFLNKENIRSYLFLTSD